MKSAAAVNIQMIKKQDSTIADKEKVLVDRRSNQTQCFLEPKINTDKSLTLFNFMKAQGRKV